MSVCSHMGARTYREFQSYLLNKWFKLKTFTRLRSKEKKIFADNSEMLWKSEWEKQEQRFGNHRAQQARSLGVPHACKGHKDEVLALVLEFWNIIFTCFQMGIKRNRNTKMDGILTLWGLENCVAMSKSRQWGGGGEESKTWVGGGGQAGQ